VNDQLEDVGHGTSGASLQWHRFAWWNARATIGIDQSSQRYSALTRFGEGSTPTGRRVDQQTGLRLYTVDLGTTATLSPASAWTARTSVGLQYTRRELHNTNATASPLGPGSITLAGATASTVAELTDQQVVAGSYVEQTVSYKQRAFLIGALRGDGSSTFGNGFKTAVYPKLSLSWLALDDALRHSVTSARLRAAYGSSGVQPGSLDALARERLFPVNVNGTPTTGAALQFLGNDQLRPERQRELELGLDVDLFSRRATLELTRYDKRSSDALLNLPLPTSAGLGEALGLNANATREINAGAVSNTGVEGSITVRPIQTSSVDWEVTGSGSHNKNRVVSLAPGIAILSLGTVRTGYPVAAWFGQAFTYNDDNGNGVIEPSEVHVAPTSTFLGARFPTQQVSVSSSLALFNGALRFATLFDHRGGLVVSDVSEANRSLYSGFPASNDPNASLESQAEYVAYKSYNVATGWYNKNGTFTRWRELSMTYQLPLAATRRLGGSTASLTLAGRNLGLWTKYPGLDPEVNYGPSPLVTTNGAAFYDNPTAPMWRYWIMRLNLGL
jgi:hypothetical protein